MTTAQVLYQHYKVLPQHIKKELKELIVKEAPFIDEDEDEDEENGDTIWIAVEPLKEGLRELKLVLAGKQKTRPLSVLLAELENETND